MNAKLKRHRLINLKELLGGRYFKIPNYQRGYSWENEQRLDLLDDIVNICTKSYKHYTGTVVAKELRGDNRFEIVDGQQRLTSLIILLNEILYLQDSNLTDDDRSFLFNLINYRNNNPHDRALTFSPEVDTFFVQNVIVRSKVDSVDCFENKSWQNMLDARMQFHSWLQNNYRSELLTAILENLGFLFFQPEKNESVGVMFEVINNRGKRLSELEKIKNYLIYYSIVRKAPQLQSKIESNWPEILKNLMEAGIESNQEEDSFLRNCWILYFTTDKSKSYQVYSGMKGTFPPDGQNDHTKKLEAFIELLVGASRAYREFYTSTTEAHILLRNQPVQASILPLYLAIKLSELDEDSERDLLQLLEKLNFRIYIVPDITKRSDSRQNELFGFAQSFFGHHVRYRNSLHINYSNEQNSVSKLRKSLIDLILYWCPAEKLVEGLTLDMDEGFNYYSWIGLRYFLANYEHSYFYPEKKIDIRRIMGTEKGYATKSADKYEKEHLWAEKNLEGKFDNGVDKHEKGRLGNFVLLEKPINASIKKQHIDQKLRSFEKNVEGAELRMVRQLAKQVNEAKSFMSNWKRRTIKWYLYFYTHLNDIREKEMITWALDRWGVEGDTLDNLKIDSFEKDEHLYNLSPKTRSRKSVYRYE